MPQLLHTVEYNNVLEIIRARAVMSKLLKRLLLFCITSRLSAPLPFNKSDWTDTVAETPEESGVRSNSPSRLGQGGRPAGRATRAGRLAGSGSGSGSDRYPNTITSRVAAGVAL